MTQRYSDIENAAPPDDGGGYQYPETGGDPPLSIELPEATPSQKIAMDEFIKSPSQDRWQELVETMIRQRQEQEQSIEFFSQRSSYGKEAPEGRVHAGGVGVHEKAAVGVHEKASVAVGVHEKASVA
eukprot:CAMPEP_0201918650 /NCGR_PEP_ID=MMETSP0903-20130614/7743_1 /ASSEMBLY_ACC=CAM_ASM_000552 /TAXON_ID=420261 /ORGANISM="Thalassiosira antarctica, Strain CCMP982" /LENGTH=126 /DNA_ID=CAMNT_0048454997 /DNA_START=97 /DNA_END=474 /DNA_ORIENTATION=+